MKALSSNACITAVFRIRDSSQDIAAATVTAIVNRVNVRSDGSCTTRISIVRTVGVNELPVSAFGSSASNPTMLRVLNEAKPPVFAEIRVKNDPCQIRILELQYL